VIRIGIDFGGTKIEAAALNETGEFLSRLRVPNPGEYRAAIKAVTELVTQIEAEADCGGTVGVGTPGSISPTTGAMRNSNSVYLNGRRFREDLAHALGREIRLANDANCLALSESVDGAARGAQTAFGIILGTGCGGGLVANGQLIEGANGIAGEWGQNPLPWPTAEEIPGPLCWCGRSGCLEMWVSGTGLQMDYRLHTSLDLTGEEIILHARAGEKEAAAAFERYVGRLGRAVAMVCNIADPDVIVLGGGLSNIAEIYQRLPDIIRKYVFSDSHHIRILPAKWGDSSGVRGAARLWPTGSRSDNNK